MVNKYELLYKEELALIPDLSGSIKSDLLISSYDGSDRVKTVFNSVRKDKVWAISNEYQFSEDELPDGAKCFLNGEDEAEAIINLIKAVNPDKSKSICIDISGFIRPYIPILIKHLKDEGFGEIELLYSEPSMYCSREDTQFADSCITEVRQIGGFEGIHDYSKKNDFLIIAVGYEHEVITRTAESKNHCSKIQLFGFPSLRPEMYHENVYQVSYAAEAIGSNGNSKRKNLYAPAYDPFITASVLSETVKSLKDKNDLSNLYLCPLSTKAQVLGFSVFYLSELENTASSIIYPFGQHVAKNPSKGISRLWKFVLDFNILNL